MTNARTYILATLLLLAATTATAQRFFNLTADEVRIDSLLPQFACSVPLADGYQDSTYTVSIAYPEYIDMSQADIRRYNSLSGAALPAVPAIRQQVSVNRKKGVLQVSFCPLVFRNNKYQMLVSFMLDVQSRPLRRSQRRAVARTRGNAQGRYADHSVLATGRWAKIRVPASGVYQLTEALIRQAGFSDLSKVKVYGYGGALQNETLAAADLERYDDLQEVATCTVGGRRLFHAQGPVSWSSPSAAVRTRNPYANYGYYFLTQTDAEPLTVDSAAFLQSFYPAADDYHTLHEVDNFAWYAGGRNLFEDNPIAAGSTRSYQLAVPAAAKTGKLTVALTAGAASSATVAINGTTLGSLNITLGEYDKGNETIRTYTVDNLSASNEITITATSGGPVRLDYLSLSFDRPREAPQLRSGSFPSAEYVYNITNQDHHADGPADMVIIIPTSQKLLSQANRLKAFHEQHDGLRVRIVPADELINEFGSGTPDANAYRRYLKMLYDRAATEADMPKYLLLFGDCLWDNRLLTSANRGLNPDDLLLCFESENSFNEVSCFVDDGFFCLLDDGEGADPQASDKLDMAVGRFPVTTEAEAKVMVDKTINYARNASAGSWQNTIVFMGDDGNYNLHMQDADDAANDIALRHPGYMVKKIMWDAYTRQTSSTGKTYPEVSAFIKQAQRNGALIMDYAGHGSETQISHESVLRLSDFQQFSNTNLPLWITASCDIMPFDGTAATIGEAAVLNPKGGAVAMFGTTRTVYAYYNKLINMAYLRYVLSRPGGKAMTIGEAQRMAKNELLTSRLDNTTNKLQYSLLGDPALALHLPALEVVVDAVNGAPATQASTLKAGSVVKVEGHIEGANDFSGVVTATVRDAEERIVCKRNDTSETDDAFEFYDRTKTLFNGTDSISNGRFAFSFAVPRDISYSGGTGLINLHAVSADHLQSAHGSFANFTIAGGGILANDSIGPSIYCYLNSPSFANGGNVNTTPYFVAKITDEDGVNTTGNGIGHDLQLCIDGEMATTYVLNDHFSYDFGSYTSGSTWYNLPPLAPGRHKLQFRAWDVKNNSAVAELTFNVVQGLEPNLFSVDVTENPARNSTTFIINHDRTGSLMDVDIDIFDVSGRHIWTHSESGVPTDGAYTVSWDLTVDGGRRLTTGVYLYRVRVGSDGSKKASKAKKLVVIRQ